MKTERDKQCIQFMRELTKSDPERRSRTFEEMAVDLVCFVREREIAAIENVNAYFDENNVTVEVNGIQARLNPETQVDWEPDRSERKKICDEVLSEIWNQIEGILGAKDRELIRKGINIVRMRR